MAESIEAVRSDPALKNVREELDLLRALLADYLVRRADDVALLELSSVAGQIGQLAERLMKIEAGASISYESLNRITHEMGERLVWVAEELILNVRLSPLNHGHFKEPNLTRRHFRPLLRAAGLPEDLRLYGLRHSCATILLAQGHNVKVVSERLGHSAASTTLNHYAHALPGQQAKASEAMGTTVYGTGGQGG